MVISWIISAVWWVVTRPLRIVERIFQSGDHAYSSLDHLALNVTKPRSEWLNMGNWSNTNEFPQAGHDLAELLYKEAGLTLSASVLDVGHGSGDSLLLLARDYSPQLLHGVTTIPAHTIRSQTRMKKQETDLENSTKSWKLFNDDAINFLKNSKTPKYDFIFALDCAYHFQSRKEFLNLCYQTILPGGKVALIDLAASHPYPSRQNSAYFTPSTLLPPPQHRTAAFSSQVKHAITTSLSGVPRGNLVSIEQYHSDLITAGFDDITIKDISHLVFPGFARFLRRLGKEDEAAWRGGGFLQTTALRSFGSVVEGWSRGSETGMVRCVLVIAAKKGQ